MSNLQPIRVIKSMILTAKCFYWMFKISIILWLFLVSCSLYLNAQDITPADSLTPALRALTTLEIPDYAQSSREIINQVNDVLNEEETLSESLSDVGETESQIQQKITLSDSTEEFIRLDRLNEEKRALDNIEEKLNRWETDINEWLEKAAPLLNNIDTSLLVWKLTQDSLQVRQTPQEVNQDSLEAIQETNIQNNIDSTVNSFINELTEIQSIFSNSIFEIKNNANRISIAFNHLELARSSLAEKRKNMIGNIWIPESPPIWQMHKDTASQDSTEESRLQSILSNYQDVGRDYVKENANIIYTSLFTFILILALLVYLRKRADDYYHNFQDELKEAKILLNHPITASIIVSSFLLSISQEFPREVENIISIIVLGPISYLLWLLWNKTKPLKLIFFIIVYLFFVFLSDLIIFPILHRYLLLFINLLVIIILYRVQEQDLLKTEKFWSNILPYLIKFFFLLNVVSVLANILGMVQLTQLITNSILGTYVFFVLLMEILFLIRSLLYLLILGPMYKKSYILQEDSKTILDNIDATLMVIGYVVLGIYTLDLLNIRELLYDGLVNFLNQPIIIGEVSFTLENILAFLITLLVSNWLSKIIRYILDKEVFPRGNLHEDETSTISLLVRYAITIIGFFLALAAAGIDFDQLSIALGGLGVGIGFGMQNIVNNFVSGIILAVDRPITIGDTVDIGDVSGIVQEIGFRSTTVRSWEGSEVIIPNGDLIAANLTNWTLSNNRRRVKTEIRVPFDTDLEAIKSLLIETAAEIPVVMKNPGPYLNFQGMGTSAMEINLYCWIEDTNNYFSQGTHIRTTVFNALSEAGFEISVPKTDIKLLEKEA